MTAEAAADILACTPIRLADWRADGSGRVVVERPSPATAGFRGAWDRLRWLMSHPRIRFDELGSHVWRQMDGAATLREISLAASAAFPDRADHMDQRIALFATALHHQGLIELRV